MKFGIQMYLFRNKSVTKGQTLRTLKRVADMGWDGIELFGCQNIPAEEIRAAVGSCDILNPMLWHKNFEPDKIQKICDWVQALGAETAAYSSIPVLHANADVYREYNPKYQRIAKAFAANGLTFCHHNHRDEYSMMEGRYGIDILIENVQPYCLEIDTYWAKEAGCDPVALMEQRKEHLRYVHLKDKAPGAKKFCPLGEGNMDNLSIVKKAEELGIEYIILDLDNSTCNVFEAAEKSLAWLRSNFG